MSKKMKIIIAVIAAVLIIVVIALCVGGNDKKGSDRTFGDRKHNSKVEENVDDAEVTGGVEDSIFDEESSEGEASSGSSGDGNKSSSDSNKSNSSSSSKNDSSSSDKNSSSSNKNEQSSTAKPGEMDYETFHAMSPADQQAYMESFDDVDKFFKWYNKAKAQYEKENPAIEVDGKKPVELK